MRALITGAGGFVGRHLTAHLTAAGDEVWGVVAAADDTAATAAGRTLVADIRDAAALARAVAAASPEAIYHLAGISTVVTSSAAARGETLDVNVTGAGNVLEAALAMKRPARTLLVGSAEQYGRSARADRTLAEDDPLRPVSTYGLSKTAQELLGRHYAAELVLDVVLVRAFNHTGPGQSPAFVVPDWTRQVAEMEAGKREPRLVVGNLDVVKDFSDVRDIVRLYRRLVEDGIRGEVYNACSGVGRRLGEVVDVLKALARVEFTVAVDEARVRNAEVTRVVGSPEKVRHQFDWRPQVAFRKTVRDVLEYWREQVRQ